MDIAKLVARLELQSSQFQAELEKTNKKILGFQQQTNRSLNNIQKSVQNFSTNIRSNLAAAFGAYLSVRSIQSLVRISDEYAQINGRLALVTDSTEQLARVQQSLFQIAQRTRTEFSGVADLYIKAAQSGRELGASEEQLLAFTEGVGNALRVSGASAQSASGALLQLSQALVSGTVRAEEFNSINEGAPEILRAVARNIDGMGGSIGKLRAAVLEGRISSREFFAAFLKDTASLEERARRLPVTVGQAFTALQNQIGQALGSANLSPLTNAMNEFAALLANPANQRALATFSAGIVNATANLVILAGALANVLKRFGEFFAEMRHGPDTPFARMNKELGELTKQRTTLLESIRSNEEAAARTQSSVLQRSFNEAADKARTRLMDIERRMNEINGELLRMGRQAEIPVVPEKPKTLSTDLAALEAEPVGLTEAMLRNIRDLERYRALIDKVDWETQEWLWSTADIERTLLDLPEPILELSDSLIRADAIQDEFSRSMFNNFSNLFMSIGTGAENMAQQFINTIKRMLADQATLKLFEFLGSWSSGASGKGGVTGAVGSFLSSIFGGTKDSGGRGQKGKIYAIGTGAQPELFVPDTPGTFYPRGELVAAGAGMGSVVLNLSINNDNRGASIDLIRALPEHDRRLAQQIEATIVQKLRRRQYNLG